MYVTLDIANICDDESEKEKLELFLQPKMSGIKIEICPTVNSIRKLNIHCLYGLSWWKELEQNSDEAKSLMPQGYISNYIRLLKHLWAFSNASDWLRVKSIDISCWLIGPEKCPSLYPVLITVSPLIDWCWTQKIFCLIERPLIYYFKDYSKYCIRRNIRWGFHFVIWVQEITLWRN